jgi:hypothetical protein
MTPQKTRRQPKVAVPAVFAEARDELFHHIMQCGVIDADAAHQTEWFGQTMAYMSERYHELAPEDLAELRLLGERFCQPPKTQTQNTAAD